MSKILNLGKELLRINPNNPQRIEYSTNDGRSWTNRYQSSFCGNFEDLTDNVKEIIATTDKGLYYSTNDGRSWSRRG